MHPEDAHSKSPRPGVAADAHGERIVDDLHIRKTFLILFLPGEKLFFVHVRLGHAKLQDALVPQMGEAHVYILSYRLAHSPEGGLHAPDLGEGIQLFSLNLQNRLNPQKRPQGRGRRGDSPAFFQIFQSVHRDINDAVPPGSLQDLLESETYLNSLK